MSSPTSARPPAPQPDPTSLFARVGGSATLRGVVDTFYDRVLADPALQHYFRGVDDGRLRSHQHRFLTAALGGPRPSDGPDLAAAHGGRGITPTAFDLVAGHLLAAFAGTAATAADRAEIADALGSYRALVVAPGQG